eukprot:4285299-Prymnesium_polylepis.1
MHARMHRGVAERACGAGRSRGLVEEQQLRLAQQASRDREPLLLAAREARAALADARREAVLELLDKAPRLRVLERRHEVFARVGRRAVCPPGQRETTSGQRIRTVRRSRVRTALRIGTALRDVLADRRVEELRLLRDDADAAVNRREVELAQVDASQADAPLHRVVVPEEQVDERRLAAAGAADESADGALRHAERHAL